MTLIRRNDQTKEEPRTVILGIGGAGRNIVSDIAARNMPDIENILYYDTDEEYPLFDGTFVKGQIGEGIISNILSDTDILFLVCGMGGNTATDAVSEIAKAAKEKGIAVGAVVTRPFQFENRTRSNSASIGIDRLKEITDALVVIPNDSILRIVDSRITVRTAFQMMNELIGRTVLNMIPLLRKPFVSDLSVEDACRLLISCNKETGEGSPSPAMIDKFAG